MRLIPRDIAPAPSSTAITAITTLLTIDAVLATPPLTTHGAMIVHAPSSGATQVRPWVRPYALANPRASAANAMLAGYLCTRHHSAVQLIDRTEQLGLITRSRGDDEDRRVVRLALAA